MIPLAVILVRASLIDASVFFGCYEPGLCDQRFYIITPTRDACGELMTIEFLQRVKNGWLYDSRNVGIFAACRDFKVGILYTLCRDPQTLQDLPDCARLRVVSGHTPEHVNATGPRDRPTPRRGVSVLGQ